jgi:hypothetical protein
MRMECREKTSSTRVTVRGPIISAAARIREIPPNSTKILSPGSFECAET